MSENNIFSKLTKETQDIVHDVATACTDSVKEVGHTAAKTMDPSQISDYAHRKVAVAVNRFTECLPLFEQAGFSLRCFDLEVGVSPHMTPRFIIGNVPNDERKRELLKEAKKLGGSAFAVLTALFKAVELKQHLHLGKLKLVGLNVTVGAMPAVRLVFE